MTPEQKQAIKTYVEAISAILYADCDPESLKTLEDIEITVKDQVLTHVTPEIGFFLSTQLAVQKQSG
jgi:hypothetical protein